MKVPLIRVGITLAVGSVVASAVQFYVAMGAAAADLNATVPTTGRPVGDWFVKDFLFQGTIPTGLFWTGIAIAGLGCVVMALGVGGGSRRRATVEAVQQARLDAQIAAFRAEGGGRSDGDGSAGR